MGAVGKMIAMGAAMDPKLLKAGAEAHHSALQGLPANGVCSEAQLTAITAAIGRMIASVPESMTMDVYNSVKGLVDPQVPAYLMSTVKEADAKAAYNALIEFTQVVKAHPITPSTPASTVSGAASVDAAAGKLSAAAYPFIKDVDWTSNLFSKPIPGQSPQAVLKAVDKMIVMGQPWMGQPSRRRQRPMSRPSMAWMRRACCRRPTSRPSMQGSGRRLHRCLRARSWTSTTRWPRSSATPPCRTTCIPR